jgi:hypothetical protein
VTAAPRAGEREVRALPVIAVAVLLATIAAIVYAGRVRGPAAARAGAASASGAPAPVRDTDHYVPGSPPAVAERFLRAWMRARYDEAGELAAGPMRARAAREQGEVGGFNAAQMDEYRHTRAYLDATCRPARRAPPARRSGARPTRTARSAARGSTAAAARPSCSS